MMTSADEFEDVLEDFDFGPEPGHADWWINGGGDVRFVWLDTESMDWELHRLDRSGVAFVTMRGSRMPRRMFAATVDQFTLTA